MIKSWLPEDYSISCFLTPVYFSCMIVPHATLSGEITMGCCDDPTEPSRIDPRQLIREQEHYGNLVRDLFTDDPEKVILRQLNEANTYLRELAALSAHYDSVRKRAIELLGKDSFSILERIINKEADTEIGKAALHRLTVLKNGTGGLLNKFFKSS